MRYIVLLAFKLTRHIAFEETSVVKADLKRHISHAQQDTAAQNLMILTQDCKAIIVPVLQTNLSEGLCFNSPGLDPNTTYHKGCDLG